MSDLYALAEEMAHRGVGQIFGIPGSGSSLTLLDALEKRGVIFYLTHFEGTAAMMAGAVGRLSGRAGAAISIKGPGLANMVPGLAACRFESLPVVSLSEAYPPGTVISKAHKRMNHNRLISAAAKGRRFLSRNGPRFSDLARWAEEEIPGPVHLDIVESAIDNEESIPLIKEEGSDDSNPQGLHDLVTAADRPVIIAGTLSLRKTLSSRLNQLSIPVFSTAACKGVVDETLPNAAGVYTGVGLELTPEFSIIPKADLVVGIGLRHHEVLNAKPFGCKGINIDPLGSAHCSGFNFDRLCEGSPEEVNALFSALSSKKWGIESLRACSGKMREKILSDQFMPANAFRVIERHFMHRIRLVLDTGNFCTMGEHTWRVPKPDLYLAAGQGRYMGVGLPMALGAAIYDPDIPTVVFLGDGGIGMFMADIKMALKYRLPLLVVLMSDGHFGSIRGRSVRDGLTEKPVTIHRPSWIKAVEGLGVHALEAKNEEEIEDGLKAWNPPKGPLFIEIPFDPEGYLSMVEDIR